MPFATATLPHRGTLEPYLGTTGKATRKYDTAIPIKARCIKRRSVLRGSTGVDVVCTVQIDIRPDYGSPALQSRITIDGAVYYVEAVAEAIDLRRVEGYNLSCSGPHNQPAPTPPPEP